MNYDQHVAASFQAGFEQRLQHLVTKSAMVKAAGGLTPMWRRLGQQAGKGLARVRPAVTPFDARFTRFAHGPSPGQRTFWQADPTVVAARASRNPAALAARGSSNLIREIPVAAQTTRGARPAAGKLIRETPVAAQTTRGPVAGGGKPPTPPTPPPGPAAAASPPPNAAPGTVTPDQMRQMGLVTTRRGFGAGAGGPAIDVDATVSAGDPTGGLLSRIRNMLPGGARAWAERNPELYGGALGALGGGGAVMAGDQYGDWRRRRAIENLGLLDRLGLALQLAASPRGFNQTLGL